MKKFFESVADVIVMIGLVGFYIFGLTIGMTVGDGE